jgi:hypothetical protein
MESKWFWLLGGVAAGFFLSKSVMLGGSLDIQASAASVGGGRKPAGSGAVPLDQPTGTLPYQQVGAYNPYFSAGFPDLPDPGANSRIIETNEPGMGYIQ